MERLVSLRLIHLLEAGNKLAPRQAGFRKGRSTEEQLARITQDMFDGLEEQAPRKSVLVLLDYTTACDRVWKNVLHKKLTDLGVPVCMIRWLKGFLNKWRARVNWKNTLSRLRVFSEGLSQAYPLTFTAMTSAFSSRRPPQRQT